MLYNADGRLWKIPGCYFPEIEFPKLPAYAEGPTRLCGDECVAGNPP
jgi:hypothetical protein